MTNSAAPRGNAKFVFLGLVVITVLLMQIAFTVTLVFADHRRLGGTRHLGGFGGTLFMPFLMIGILFATAVCRRLGLVEQPRVEVLRRHPTPGSTSTLEAVELRTPLSVLTGLGVVMVVFAVLVGILVVTLPAVPGTQVDGFGTALAFGGLGLLVGLLRRIDGVNFVARVDAEGVTGYDGLRRRTVRWLEVAACQVVTAPIPGGDPASHVYTLRGAGGRRLMRLVPMLVPQAERERFDRALRAAFGEADTSGSHNISAR